MNLVDIMFVCVNIMVDFDVLETYLEDPVLVCALQFCNLTKYKNERKMTFKHYYLICPKPS